MSKQRYPLAETDMSDPMELDANLISVFVEDDTYGVYVLLSPGTKNPYVVLYVGQGDVKNRLLAHAKNKGGSHFAYKEVGSEIEAYHEECRLFHTYGAATYLNNENHPPRPSDTDEKCRFKGCDYSD